MSRRAYRARSTGHRIGRYRIVTVDQLRGYAILDNDGRYAFTELDPVGARRPAMTPTIRSAYRVARALTYGAMSEIEKSR